MVLGERWHKPGNVRQSVRRALQLPAHPAPIPGKLPARATSPCGKLHYWIPEQLLWDISLVFRVLHSERVESDGLKRAP